MTRNELVEKMFCAYLADHGDRRKGMSAALDVAMGELLGDCDSGEADRAYSAWQKGCGTTLILDNFVVARRAQLEKVKTPEDRVTIKEVNSGWVVYSDDADSWFSYSKRDCEIYRLGLIAKLKEQS